MYDVDRASSAVDLHTKIRPATSYSKEAAAFRVSLGSPLLDITRVTYNEAGQPLPLLRCLLSPQCVHVGDRRLPLTVP
ncbi:hypothetical protein GCM10009733_006410 [Nonomuraea maheshkhaliensis]|uniref:UTRA domain-containing protein n=1 Tax=Nonomuraea maheshkhaliensis TaxID=419590 RepID=A0ABP4QIY2_9ACTN